MENSSHDDIFENANEHFPGAQSVFETKSNTCQGCSNQQDATAPKCTNPDLALKSTCSAILFFGLASMGNQVGLLKFWQQAVKLLTRFIDQT